VLNARRVTVTTSATQLDNTSIRRGTFTQANQASLLVRNRGSVAVYIGGDATVTTSTGYQLDPGETWIGEIESGDAVYGIVASGTAVCHLVTTGAN